MTHYIHHLPGRLRLKARQLKRNPDAAAAARTLLLAQEGVTCVEANLTTGSLLISYDPLLTGAERLLAALNSANLFNATLAAPEPMEERRAPERPGRLAGMGNQLGKAVLNLLVEKAVERSAMALVGAIL